MSYIIGALTLPNPHEFRREQVETSKTNETIEGRTKKDIANRKERYFLRFDKLTQAEVNSILAEYDLQTTRTFQVTETNLTIAATDVHIELAAREYNTRGDSYREDLTLILTEVI